jgi:octaprenyl-diphosphate synthase
MGKSVGDDFRESKMTLPVILSLKNASEEERRFWRRTIEVSVQEEGDLSRAIEILERGGALAETIEQARLYAKAAREALTLCAESEIKMALADIADFVVERAY